MDIKSEPDKMTENKDAQPAVLKEGFGTQIFASSRTIDPHDPMFMGYEPVIVNIGSLNKYIIGVSESEDEARKANEIIKVKYPGSFMVRISSNSVTRFK